MKRWHHWLRRALRAFSLGVLGLVAAGLVLCLIGCVYLSSEGGKARLLRAVVSQLNGVLPGRVSVRELSELGANSVTLRGIEIHAPSGDSVLQVETLQASLELWPLLRREIVVPELALKVTHLDLRFPADAHRGLVSAFVAGESTPTASTPTSALPNVRIERLSLALERTSLPPGQGWSTLELRALTLDAGLRGGLQPSLELRRAAGELWRDAEKLGSIAADGELQVSDPAGWSDPRFDCRLELSEFNALRLALLLGDPGFTLNAAAALAARVRVHGTVRQLELAAAGQLEVGGETLSFDARARALAELVVELQTEGLHLRRLASELPDWFVTNRATLSVAAVPQTSALRLELQAASSVNGVSLPDLTLRAELVEQARLRGLELRLEDTETNLSVTGEASAAEASLRVDGNLELQRAVEIGGALGWPLPAARGRVGVGLRLERERSGRVRLQGTLKSEELRLAEARLERIQAQFSLAHLGALEAVDVDASWRAASRSSIALTPGRLQLRGNLSRQTFELQGGGLGVGLARASGWLERRRAGARLALTASGSWQGSAWSLELQPTELLEGGRIRSPGMTVGFAGQRAKLHGEYAPRDSHLTLEFSGVDLPSVLRPFEQELPRSGTLSGCLLASGSLERPALSLQLSATRLTLAQGPALNAELQGSWDAWQLEAHTRVQDPQGSWLTLDGHLDLTPVASVSERFAELLRSPGALALLLEDAAWRVQIGAEPRVLERWPLPAGLAAFGAARLGARLSASHRPGAEPEGKLEFDLRGFARGLDRAAQVTEELGSSGQIEFGAGRFHAQASALRGQQRLLKLETQGQLELLPLLRGQPLVVPKLDVEAEVSQLPLAQVPVVGRHVRGVLSSKLQLRDALGTPRGELDVRVAGLSFGSDETVDFDAQLAIDPQQAELRGAVQSEGSASTFAGKLPLRWSAGTVSLAAEAPLEVLLDLRRLRVAPFLPGDGPLSDASGTLSGSLRVGGPSQKPQFTGNVRLEQVAVTVTELAQPLSDIQGELALTSAGLELKGFSARDGEGTLALDGRCWAEPDHALAGSFTVVAQKFPLRQAGQVAAVTSANARVDARWRQGDQSLRIRLEKFDTWLDDRKTAEGLALAAHPDVVVDELPSAAHASAELARPVSPAVTPAAPPAVPGKWSIDIDAGQQFWVRRADFELKLAAVLRIVSERRSASTPADVRMTGEVTFDRGQVELMGRAFQVERGGTLRFIEGGALLNLTAKYHDRRADKMLKVHLHGNAESPRLDFRLDDVAITPAEAFRTIYGTRDDDDDDVDEAEAQAGQLVSAVTAGMLTTSIRRTFGAMAPIVTIEPTDNEGSSEMRAGFELDEVVPNFLRDIVTGVYVEGIVASEKDAEAGTSRTMQGGVLIELHFPYNLVTSGRYGPDSTWSVDLGWQPP